MQRIETLLDLQSHNEEDEQHGLETCINGLSRRDSEKAICLKYIPSIGLPECPKFFSLAYPCKGFLWLGSKASGDFHSINKRLGYSEEPTCQKQEKNPR